MVVKRWAVWLLLRIRNRQRLRLSAGDPRARPNAGHTCGEVPIFVVVDAANRLHTGN
jgi:hypothetical protein